MLGVILPQLFTIIIFVKSHSTCDRTFQLFLVLSIDSLRLMEKAIPSWLPLPPICYRKVENPFATGWWKTHCASAMKRCPPPQPPPQTLQSWLSKKSTECLHQHQRNKQIWVTANLGHCVMIRLLLWVSPVNNDVALPHLDTTRRQLPLGSGSIFVAVILEESKPSILELGVVSRSVHDHINKALCKKFSDMGLAVNSHNTQKTLNSGQHSIMVSFLKSRQWKLKLSLIQGLRLQTIWCFLPQFVLSCFFLSARFFFLLYHFLRKKKEKKKGMCTFQNWNFFTVTKKMKGNIPQLSSMMA